MTIPHARPATSPPSPDDARLEWNTVKLHGVCWSRDQRRGPDRSFSLRAGPDEDPFLLAELLSPPPFPCQFSLYPLFVTQLCLGSLLRLGDDPRFLDRFFHLSRLAKAGPSQIACQPQLLRKLFLPDKWRSLFTERIGDFLLPAG